MSGFKGHILGGLIVSILVIYFIFSLGKHLNIDIFRTFIPDTQTLIVLLAISVLFTLFPDVDTHSIGRKIFYSVFLITDIYLIFTGDYKSASVLGLFAILPAVGKHRGWTHKKITGLIISSGFLVMPYFLNNISLYQSISYFGASLTGYYSHLLMDGILFKS